MAERKRHAPGVLHSFLMKRSKSELIIAYNLPFQNNKAALAVK